MNPTKSTRDKSRLDPFLTFDSRQKGDYADLVRFDIDGVASWFDEAQHFVSVVEKFIKREMEEYLSFLGIKD